MSSWRIRELEDKIEKLERDQREYDRFSDKWNELERELDDLRNELRRLKRRLQEEESTSRSIIGMGTFGLGSHFGGGFGRFGGFGGGGFGGSGAGGHF